MKTKRIIGAEVAVVLLALVLAGCARTDGTILLDPQGEAREVTPEEVEEFSGDDSPYLLQIGDQVNLSFRVKDYRAGEVPWDYRIEVGDSMEVRLSAEMGERDAYLIDTGDLIGISFLDNWQLNSNRTVRPDGMITMPEVGDVKAGGLTAQELRAKLNDLYARTGIINGEPKITVNVDFSNPDRLENMSRDVVVRPDGCIRIPGMKRDIRIAGLTVGEGSAALQAEVARMLRNAPVVTLVVFPYVNTALAGMNGLFTVRPDGMITVPRLGEMQVCGYSANELRTDLNEACKGLIFNEVDSSVDVVTVTGSRIYVGGQVGIPGVYPLASSPTALQAIMMARGGNDHSRLNSVLVVRRNPNGKPYVFKTNLHRALSKGSTENDIPLKPFDIVYVPKKLISRANLFVEQYIEEMVPFDNSMGVTATYYMNTQKSNTTSKSKNWNTGITAIPSAANAGAILNP